MLPVIALVGRPNVGKSTLFNCLTRTRNAIVADLPGVTRDRQYGEGENEGTRYIVIDTGGMELEATSGVFSLMTDQSLRAIEEADIILWVVDAKDGLTPSDIKIASTLRQAAKPTFLVVNKSESMDPEIAKGDFYQLGFAHVFAIASAHNRGVTRLIEAALKAIPKKPSTELPEEFQKDAIKVAVIGRPNVGKSTLVNRLLGEDRVLVFDEPGTTRDSIYIPFKRGNQAYVLIDTAGVRRKTKINEAVEKFSVIKALQTIEAANVIIFVFNARETVSDQDLRLIDFIIEAGRALVIAINKWDGMTIRERDDYKSELQRRLEFASFAKQYFISALHGTAVGDLLPAVLTAYRCATKKISTPLLTRALMAATVQHQPPLVQGRRIKLRYAHIGGHNPPLIVIHGNQTQHLPTDYVRFLTHFFINKFRLVGTPIRIELKSGENPFKDRKNILTPRQIAKRKRLRYYTKK